MLGKARTLLELEVELLSKMSDGVSEWTQSPKNLVGVSALPTLKFLRVRKVFARIYKIDYKVKPKHQCKGEKVLECTRLSGKFPESLESFQKVWKVSGQSGNFPKSLENFRTVWKVSKQCQKFPVMCPMINMAYKQK